MTPTNTPTNTPRVEITDDLLTRIMIATRDDHVAIMSDPYNRFGDDWGDDTHASLTIMTAVFEMQWDQSDLAALDVMLNTPAVEWAQTDTIDVIDRKGRVTGTVPRLCALANVPQIFSDLGCPAMAEPTPGSRA